jgi:hypothetical protein
MNASRRLLKASSNTVKQIYTYGEKSVQGHIIEGSIIVILIVLTAVVLKFLPLKFLCFFNNIIVKVIFLIVIAFVALYCPAIGLMLAILLVSIIQMCQRKQLSMEINNIQNSAPTGKNMQPDMNVFESMGNQMGNNKDYPMGDQMGSFDNIMESYDNQGGNMQPQGFNEDTSCLSGCGGSGSGGKRDSRNELNGMCGNVKTWSNQESAQGLDGEVVGLQSSIGYPL